jgi:hypothetical protein
MRNLTILLSLTLSTVVYASAYSQYRLIKQEVINNQTVCTYENVRKDIITRTHKPRKQCAKYINTDRD